MVWRVTACFILAFAFLSNSSRAEKTFRFPLAFEPKSLDWSYKRGFHEITVILNIMEGLIETDEKFNPVPQLAEKWIISEDRLTYTFVLRENVKWSDGKPLRARDFVYSWRRLLSPKNRSEYGDYLHDIKNAEAYHKGAIRDFDKVGIKALDDRRIEIKLERPTPNFVQKFRLYVTFPQRPDIKHTLGPYRISRWSKGKFIEFEPNPNYYGKKPRVPRVHAHFESATKKLRALADKSSIDLLFGATTSDIVRYTTASKSQWRVEQFPSLNVTFLAFKVSKENTASLAVRKAIAMSLDRKKFSAVQTSGKTPADSLIPKNMLGYEPLVAPFNEIEARKHLFESGAHHPAEPLTLTIAFRDNLHDTLAEQIAEQLKSVLGIRLKLKPVPTSTFLKGVSAPDVDLYIEQWWPDSPDPTSFVQRMTSQSSFNRLGWKNTRYDIAVHTADEKQDVMERLKLYSEAQKILLQEDVAVVPLYHAKTTVLVRNNVTKFELSPMLCDFYFKNLEMK